MAIQYANRQSGNPIQGAYAITSGLTTSPLFSGMGLIKDLMGV